MISIVDVKRRVLAEYRKQVLLPFVWGQTDCLCTCGDFAQVLYDKDPIQHLRGTYDSEISARRIMVENKWKDMGDVAASIFKEIHPVDSRWGDWAQVENRDGTDGIGVVAGALVVVRGLKGLGYVSTNRAKRAFHVE